MATDWRGIGNMFSGAAAGLTGDSANFQRGLLLQEQQDMKRQEEEQKREAERRKTFFLDAALGDSLRKAGKYDQVAKLYESRAGAAAQFPGVDFSDTTQILALSELAAQGDQQAAKELEDIFGGIKQAGYDTGMLEKPEAPGYSQVTQDKSGRSIGINNQTGKWEYIPMQDGIELAPDAESSPNSQFSNADMVKDEGGNLFYVTRVGNPATGQVEAALAPIGHNNQQVGSLSRVDSLGLTAPESISHKGAEKTEVVVRGNAAEQAKDMFSQLGAVKGSIGNIDKAITAIDRGANTGPIYSMLPAVQAASVELENVRSQMGLDVVGSTTFGALSESELKFALDTAMPVNLPPAELRDWLKRKRTAQIKMATELRKGIKHFEQGGSMADYLEKMEQDGKLIRRAPPQANGDVPTLGNDQPIQQLQGGVVDWSDL